MMTPAPVDEELLLDLILRWEELRARGVRLPSRSSAGSGQAWRVSFAAGWRLWSRPPGLRRRWMIWKSPTARHQEMATAHRQPPA